MSEPLRALWARGVQSFTVEILFSPLFLFHNLERLNGMGIPACISRVASLLKDRCIVMGMPAGGIVRSRIHVPEPELS
jgi:hypothetical protein